MRVLFTIQHPAHVHLFRNTIHQLDHQGYEVFVYVREKDIAVELLELYNIDHKVLSGSSNSLTGLAVRQMQYELLLLKEAIKVDPDVMVAMSEPGVAHVSSIINCPSLLFTDTEYAWLQNKLAFPFADYIYTPTCYQKNHGENQIRYPSYHELAYLHPNRFTPSQSVLDEIGLNANDKFVILRLNAWNAAHFVGDSGFDNVFNVISAIEEEGAEVVISSEPGIHPKLEKYKFDISLKQMHNLIYYSDLLIGESATMAAESGVLGTPAVFISTSRRGYTDELSDRYGLVYTFSGSDRQQAGIEKSIEILRGTGEIDYSYRRERMLNDKIDTTSYILEQISEAGK